jgi:hypothetical protein
MGEMYVPHVLHDFGPRDLLDPEVLEGQVFHCDVCKLTVIAACSWVLFKVTLTKACVEYAGCKARRSITLSSLETVLDKPSYRGFRRRPHCIQLRKRMYGVGRYNVV